VTVLAPMRAEVYPTYVQAAVAGYAEDNIRCGRWPAQGALERSLAEFQSLLPQGLATADNHLFEILAHADGPTVGHLWFAVEDHHGQRGGYVYDVDVEPAHRRQGHARRAFELLEAFAAELGLASIGLHVFGDNPGAQALYRQLGYGVTGINMVKVLAGGAR
jgi:ribosomal protein S18 acetylase RimI-like enzyme